MKLKSLFRTSSGPSGSAFSGSEIMEYEALKELHKQFVLMSNLLVNGFSGKFPNNNEISSVENCFHFRGNRFAIKISVGPWSHSTGETSK